MRQLLEKMITGQASKKLDKVPSSAQKAAQHFSSGNISGGMKSVADILAGVSGACDSLRKVNEEKFDELAKHIDRAYSAANKMYRSLPTKMAISESKVVKKSSAEALERGNEMLRKATKDFAFTSAPKGSPGVFQVYGKAKYSSDSVDKMEKAAKKAGFKVRGTKEKDGDFNRVYIDLLEEL